MKKLGLALLVAVVAALVAASVAAAFTPTNAYYAKQWYLEQDSAFDAWPAPPLLAPVKVGIVDSGIDCSLPDFENQIAAKKSFVGGSPCIDNQGHGTVVAGEIAGALDTGGGVVGLAYSSQLVVAKVVAADGTIPVKAEAAGIRWAVNQGARVVNLSFGAVRDPKAPSLDSYSKAEAQAVAYAVKKGAVVVAAAGNSDEAYTTPWPYASWPAALPHVIGVGALTKSGNVPDFSDEDPTFVDMAAPGVGIFSTFPKLLTSAQPDCTEQGYTACAIGELEHPEGTSFAAPQVAAAAAVLFGVDPSLTSSQVTRILERHTDDVNASNGCALCLERARQVQRLGPTRRDEGRQLPQLGEPAPADRPLRAERQRAAGVQALGDAAGPRRDPRLLGRSRRRLPRAARARSACAGARRGALAERVRRPDPVAARDEVAARTEGARRVGRRIPAGRSGSRIAPRASAGTTSRCG